MKASKILTKILAVILIIMISAGTSLYIIGFCATTDMVLYIKDIKTFTGTLEEATQTAEKAGYTLFKENLASATSSYNSFIGYTTTPDRSEAVTDIKVVRMGIGYTSYDYSKVTQWLMDGMNESARNVWDVACEFTENYKAGSYLAKHAIDILNCYTVPSLFVVSSDDDENLGDFLLTNDFNENFIRNFMLRATDYEYSALYMQLATGVADADPKNTWADRVKNIKCLSSSETDEKADDKYDAAYSPYAKDIAAQVTAFCDSYLEAKAYYDEKGTLDDTEIVKACKEGEEAAEAFQEKCLTEGSAEENNYAFYIAAYNTLCKYPIITESVEEEAGSGVYKEVVTKNLGDYIVELAGLDFSTRTNLRKLYPIVAAMTEGQSLITQYVGLLQMITLLECDGSEEYIKQLNEKKEEAIKEIKEETGSDTIRLFSTINEEALREEVVVTDSLIRLNNSGDDYKTFMGTDKLYEQKLKKISSTLNIITLSLNLAQIVGNLAIGIIFGSEYVGASFLISFWSMQGVSIVGSIFGFISGIVTVAGILMLVGTLVYEFIEADEKRDKWLEVDEEEKDISYVAPPEQIYSLETSVIDGENCVAIYQGVTQYGSTSISDFNGGGGKRWNSLYVTHNEDVGSPIRVDESGNVFKTGSGNAVSITGYTSVATMGSSVPANINAYNYSGTTESKTVNDSTSRFLYYRTESSIENEKNGTATNTGTKVNAKTYLSDITVAYSNNEGSARRELESQGFTIVETNLTANQYYYYNVNSTKVYTFVGYKTTTDKNDAITDIRVINSYQETKVTFGKANYALAGKLQCGDGLYYTRSKTAGTAIVGNLYVYDSIKDAPAGYEPVNLMSGGPAYNFAKSNTENGYYSSGFSAGIDMKDMTYRYLYFQPTVMYTSGEDYLSGFFAIRSSSPGSDMNGTLGADTDWEDISLHENDTMSLQEFYTYAGRTFEDDYKVISDRLNASICYNKTTQITENDEERKIYYSDSSGASAFDEYALLCYSTTHNPYRAVYDIKVYYGDAVASSLLPSVSNKNGSYASCESYCFGTVSYEASWLSNGTGWWGYDRVAILPNHSIGLTIGSNISQDYTYTNDAGSQSYYVNVANSEEYEQVCDYTTNCLRGIYVLGNTEETDITNAKPIKASQVVVTEDKNYNRQNTDYVPVPGFMKPNSGTAVAIDGTIGKGDENRQHYIFVKDDGSGNTDLIKGNQKTYISSITVGTSKVDTSGMGTLEAASAFQKQYALIDMNARVTALSNSADEVLCCNFAALQSNTWYGAKSKTKIIRLKEFDFFSNFDFTEDDYNYTLMVGQNEYGLNLATQSAYLGVSRTDSETEAIYDVVAYKPTDGKTFPGTITVDGIKYTAAGTVTGKNPTAVIPNEQGDYALYYTTNIGAGIGRPITSVEFSNTPLKDGTIGVMCYETTDVKDKDGNVTWAKRTVLNTESEMYLNLYYADKEEGYPELSYDAYTDLCVGAGDDINGYADQYVAQIAHGGYVDLAEYKALSASEAMAEILYQGCRFCFAVDLNVNTGSCPIYIGYNGINYNTAIEREEEMITDVLFTVGEPYSKTKKVGKVTYSGCPVSLNAGTTGYQIYMYTTTDTSVASPISGIRLYNGDWRPANTITSIWGEVYDVYGQRANLNAGAARVNQGDSRIYMYVSRHDKSIKAGTAPVGGICSMANYGNISFD